MDARPDSGASSQKVSRRRTVLYAFTESKDFLCSKGRRWPGGFADGHKFGPDDVDWDWGGALEQVERTIMTKKSSV